jgi:hypothetical protein
VASAQLLEDEKGQAVESTPTHIHVRDAPGVQAAGCYPTSNNMASTSPVSPTKIARVDANKSKPVQSCQFCRRRKIRCDKLTPSCTQCLKAHTECIYPLRKGRSYNTSSILGTTQTQSREEQLIRRIKKLESAIEGLKVESLQLDTAEAVSAETQGGLA